MRLTYFPANQAYAVTMGDSIIRLDGWHLFFETRSDAEVALYSCGLRLTAKDEVVIDPRRDA